MGPPRQGGGGGGGGDVPVRRGDEPGRDAGRLGEQAGPALRPRLLLRLHRAQERRLRHGVRLVRRGHRVRHRGLRLLPADGRAGGAGPVRRTGRRDGAAAVGAAVSSAALPAAYGLPCSSPVRARRLRPQATCGHSLSSMRSVPWSCAVSPLAAHGFHLLCFSFVYTAYPLFFFGTMLRDFFLK